MDLKHKFVQEPRDFPRQLNNANFPKLYPTQNITRDQIQTESLSCFYLGHYFEKIKLTVA